MLPQLDSRVLRVYFDGLTLSRGAFRNGFFVVWVSQEVRLRQARWHSKARDVHVLDFEGRSLDTSVKLRHIPHFSGNLLWVQCHNPKYSEVRNVARTLAIAVSVRRSTQRCGVLCGTSRSNAAWTSRYSLQSVR